MSYFLNAEHENTHLALPNFSLMREQSREDTTNAVRECGYQSTISPGQTPETQFEWGKSPPPRQPLCT